LHVPKPSPEIPAEPDTIEVEEIPPDGPTEVEEATLLPPVTSAGAKLHVPKPSPEIPAEPDTIEVEEIPPDGPAEVEEATLVPPVTRAGAEYTTVAKNENIFSIIQSNS
jgi:hypothetical protein